MIMKKMMFICAALFISAQAMNAAEESESINLKLESEVPTAFSSEVMEVPGIENLEECETASYHFLSSCGHSLTMTTDRELTKDEIVAIEDAVEANC
jgi:hypothetical protein